MEWAEFLKHYVEIFPRQNLGAVDGFLNNTVSHAIIAETGVTRSSWIRASLPLNYTHDRPALKSEFDRRLDLLRQTISLRLHDQFKARPQGRELLERAFEALRSSKQQEELFDAILKRSSIYLNYAQSLIERGLKGLNQL